MKALILAPRFKASDYAATIADLAPELATAAPGRLAAARLPALRAVIELGPKPIPGAFSFDEIMARGGTGAKARLDAISAMLDPGDDINIQFTSGTTGAPKGATLSHRNIINNAISTARAMRLRPGEALCIPVPLYH